MSASSSPEPLWRELVGARLRRLRRARNERLADVAARAGISVQYLSEVERGRKEPSSEMLAAICGAYGLTVLDLASGVVGDYGRGADLPSSIVGLPAAGPTAGAATAPVLLAA